MIWGKFVASIPDLTMCFVLSCEVNAFYLYDTLGEFEFPAVCSQVPTTRLYDSPVLT